MKKALVFGLAVLACACGSSNGSGGGSGSGAVSASFLQTPIASSGGAWAVYTATLTAVAGNGSITGTMDGNSTTTDSNVTSNANVATSPNAVSGGNERVTELYVFLSNVDVCQAIKSNDQNNNPELLSLTLMANNNGLPANGKYSVASLDSASTSAVADGNSSAGGDCSLIYEPANVSQDGNGVFIATDGGVTLTSAPTASTSGSVAGTISASFQSFATVLASLGGSSDTSFDEVAHGVKGALGGRREAGLSRAATSDQSSLTGSFSAGYCAELATLLADESSQADVRALRAWERRLTPVQKQVVAAVRKARSR